MMDMNVSSGSASAQAVPDRPPLIAGWWRFAIPAGISLVLLLLSPPAGLPPHAWFYFALFAGVIAALITEPLPNAAVGLIGLTMMATLSQWVLFSPEDQAKVGFDLVSDSVEWMLSGFSSTTVWLVGAAFMFALGYRKTGLGRRLALLLVYWLGKRTITLGYAAVFSEAILAPFTPSNTARGAGIVFPIVNNLPPLYKSMPNDESANRIGSYVMWIAFAANCVTSTLFLTACAPNFLAVEFIKNITDVSISYGEWVRGSLPFALPLLLALPLLTWVFCKPQVTQSPEASIWARKELAEMGPVSRREKTLAVLVIGAIVLWIFDAKVIDPALTAFVAIALMLILGVITWSDIAKNDAAWTTIVLLATLVTLAGGLSHSGFIEWFAGFVAEHLTGYSPTLMVVLLIAVYFLSHYMFASLTAHTTAMLPVVLAVATGIPGMPMGALTLALALTTGIMGVITPYATGAALPYYNSGYLPAPLFWRLATIFGLIFIAALLIVGVPLLSMWER